MERHGGSSGSCAKEGDTVIDTTTNGFFYDKIFGNKLNCHKKICNCDQNYFRKKIFSFYVPTMFVTMLFVTKVTKKHL